MSSKCFRSGTGSGPGQHPLEVNCRAVYACRTIRAGYAGLEKVCGMMNMPRPMTEKNFDKISLVLGSSAQAVAESSMSATAVELRKPSMKDLPADIGVSVDGTWQKRGYVSLDGVVAVDSGKVIDIEVMSRYCLACQKKKDRVTDDEFLTWYESHKSFCSANHEGTAPMMEVEGTVRIFQRSIEKRNVRYMEYYGDGDSKAYSTVKDTYTPDISIRKECIGHYQKRVGTRLRKAKKVNKGLKGLPDWMIDKLQNYFGIALRANTGTSPNKMGEAIWASFLHVASSEKNNFHSLCEKGQQVGASTNATRQTRQTCIRQVMVCLKKLLR